MPRYTQQCRICRRRFVVGMLGVLALTNRHKNKTDDFRHPFCIVIERRVLVLNLNLPISFDSMSYISLSTNLVAKCDIQVDAAKVADIFDLPKFGATFLSLEERNGYIRRVFTFSKNTFRVKRRGAGLNHLSS